MKRFRTFLTEANVDLNDWTKTFSTGAYTNQLRIVGWYKYIKNKFPGPYSALVDLSRKGNDIQSRTVELTSTGKKVYDILDDEIINTGFFGEWSDSVVNKLKNVSGFDEEGGTSKDKIDLRDIKVYKDTEGSTIYEFGDLVKTAMWGGQGGTDEPEEEIEQGKGIPSSSEEYEMGFCVAWNHHEVNSDSRNLNELSIEELKSLMKQSGIDSKDESKYLQCSEILNQVGASNIENIRINVVNTGGELLHSGKKNTSPVDSWQNPHEGVDGGKNGTWKSDIYFKNGDGISIKDETGGQLASGMIGETISALYAANEDYSEGEDNNEFMNAAEEVVSHIQDEMTKKMTLKSNISKLEGDMVLFIIDNWEDKDMDWALQLYGTGRKNNKKWDDDSKSDMGKALVKIVTDSGTTKFKGDNLKKAKEIAEKINSKYVRSSSIKDVVKADWNSMVDRKKVHRVINEAGKDLFDSNDWKKYLVFEVSSGYKKWKTHTGRLPSEIETFSGDKKAIARYLLEFNKKNPTTVKPIIDIKVDDWCNEKAVKVKINASFKTASGSPQSSLRVSHFDAFKYGCDLIVESEVREMEKELLTEGLFSGIKSLANKISKTFLKIFEKVTSFIKNVFSKGMNFVMSTFGIYVDQVSVSGL